MIESLRTGPRDIEKRYGSNLVLNATGIGIRNHYGIAFTGKNGAGRHPLLGIVTGLETIRQSRQR